MATKETEAGLAAARSVRRDAKYNEELVKAGILLAAEGLAASSKGARVKFSGDERTVIDGPSTETKELIAGSSIIGVKSLEEAIEWVKRAPNVSPNGEEGQDPQADGRRRFRWRVHAEPGNRESKVQVGASPRRAPLGRLY